MLDTAYLECPHCKHQYSEAERVRAVSQGRWIATHPEIKDVRGYHISRLYSPVLSIRKLVQDFAEAFKNFDHMRFVNNALGEPYIDKENVEHDLALWNSYVILILILITFLMIVLVWDMP
ncbi:terminase gpA endonuclease subunit [Enterobacter cloacae complex sp. 357B1]|uniref:terminase gpA endonuclease subunit n=1 Tax=Enterobacter cloacae complex sp. 357B1 TaxID=3395827 RepID=UPI003CFA0773